MELIKDLKNSKFKMIIVCCLLKLNHVFPVPHQDHAYPVTFSFVTDHMTLVLEKRLH